MIYGRTLQHAPVCRHVVRNPQVAADYRVATDGDTPKYGGVGVYGDVVFQYRVARNVERLAVVVQHKVLGAERNALVYGHMVADYARLADYYAGAVVNAEVGTYNRPRVYVYTGFGVSHFRDYARQQRDAHLEQGVRDSVMQHPGECRVAENNLGAVACGGVVDKHGVDVGEQNLAQGGQSVYKSPGNLVLVNVRGAHQSACTAYLCRQLAVYGVKPYGGDVSEYLGSRSFVVKEIREHNLADKLYYLAEALHRRQPSRCLVYDGSEPFGLAAQSVYNSFAVRIHRNKAV